MAAYLPFQLKPKSLATQIREAERQVSNRQRNVSASGATLARQIHQQMTTPASLMLAGGVGFILGELTKRHTFKAQGAADKTCSSAVTIPLTTAINFITSAYTLYTAVLPLAWMVKPPRQPCEQEPIPAHQPVADASG